MSDWSLATLIMNFLFGKRITKIKFVDYKFKRSNIEKKLSFLNNMFSISFKNLRFSWAVQKKEKNVTSTLHFLSKFFSSLSCQLYQSICYMTFISGQPWPGQTFL